MFDKMRPEELIRKVEQYCENYRHPALDRFKVHAMHDLKNWCGTDHSWRPGCYAIYSESGELLYIEKASNTASVGSRLAAHLRHVRSDWIPAPVFVQIVEVGEPFEAPSLEEFLIREMRPGFNTQGMGKVLASAIVAESN